MADQGMDRNDDWRAEQRGEWRGRINAEIGALGQRVTEIQAAQHAARAEMRADLTLVKDELKLDLRNFAKEMKDVLEFQHTTQGVGIVARVLIPIVASLVTSVAVGLILYALLGKRP